MGHYCVRKSVRRRKVAHLAAKSRGYIVTKDGKRKYKLNKTISPIIEHKLVYGDLSNAITCPFTGHKFVPTNPHPVPTKYEVCITGYGWVEPKGMLFTIPDEGFKQPKRLIKCKKQKRNDFADMFPDSKYTMPKMNRVEYMEKLVQHKTVKWERKHPQPCPSDDLFKVEYQTKWYADRDAAIERFRDFVVSIYDKLPLTGRFKMNKEGTAKYQEELVAEIKDINGEGHRVNELNIKDSKLLKKAQNITDETKAKRSNLIATNLKDHKRTKGRLILPKAA